MSKKHKQPRHTPQRPVAQGQAKSQSPATSPGLKVGLILAGLAILVYVNTLGHGFVLDDPLAVTKNETVKKGVSAIPELLFNHYRHGTEAAGSSAFLYRPLSLVAFAFEQSIMPGSPAIGHLMNLLWYGATALMLFLALSRLFRNFHWAWAAGATLLFALHPIHTEVTANIKSRDELMSLFFGAASLYHWAAHLANGSRNGLIYSLLFFTLALLSKESAITLWPVFPLSAWFFYEKNAGQSIRAGLWQIAPVVLFLLMRGIALSKTGTAGEVTAMDNPIVEASGFMQRAATGFAVLYQYFQLLVFPRPLLSDYSYNHFTLSDWSSLKALGGLTLYLGLGVFALWGLPRRNALAFCAAAYLCAMALYSQLFIVIGTLFGERLAYLPSVWFCAGIAFLMLHFIGKGILSRPAEEYTLSAVPPVALAVFGALGLWYAAETWMRNPDWKSNYTLFSADSAKAPKSVRLHNGISEESYLACLTQPAPAPEEQERLLENAVSHARQAIEIRPNPISYLNIGNVHFFKKQWPEAEKNYLETLKLLPNMSLAKSNISKLYLLWGREEGQVKNNLPRSAQLFEAAIEYGGDDAEVYADLGTVYGMMGQTDRAIVNFEHCLRINPGNKTVWANLATAYQLSGNREKADECMRKARSL